MKKFEIKFKGETKTYEVPTNWGEITVGKFVDVYRLDKNTVEGTSHLNKLIDMFSILLGMDGDVIKAMDLTTFGLLKDTIAFLYDSSDLAKITTSEQINVGDKTLYVNTKFDNLTVEDMINIEGITKNNEDLVDAMVPLLSYLIKEKDSNGDLVTSSVDMSQLRIIDVYSLITVFSNGVPN